MGVDAFSRFAVTVPIEGNINAARAKDALLIIIKKMNQEFPDHSDKIRIIQTDKGSEFMGVFIESSSLQGTRGRRTNTTSTSYPSPAGLNRRR